MSRRIYATRERGDFAWYGLGCGESLCLVRGCSLARRNSNYSMFLCNVSHHRPSQNGVSEGRGAHVAQRTDAVRERGELVWYGLGCGDSWRLVRAMR